MALEGDVRPARHRVAWTPWKRCARGAASESSTAMSTMRDVAELIEAAIFAPNHKQTQPWRFTVLRGDARARLGAAWAASEATRTSLTGRDRDAYLRREAQKPLRAPVLIVVSTRTDADPDRRDRGLRRDGRSDAEPVDWPRTRAALARCGAPARWPTIQTLRTTSESMRQTGSSRSCTSDGRPQRRRNIGRVTPPRCCATWTERLYARALRASVAVLRAERPYVHRCRGSSRRGEYAEVRLRYAEIAQSVEHRSEKPGVASSILALGITPRSRHAGGLWIAPFAYSISNKDRPQPRPRHCYPH